MSAGFQVSAFCFYSFWNTIEFCCVFQMSIQMSNLDSFSFSCVKRVYDIAFYKILDTSESDILPVGYCFLFI